MASDHQAGGSNPSGRACNDVRRVGQGGGHPIISMTVVATTGSRFSDFAPYVAAVDDAGTVAFQATLQGSGTSVFLGSGGPVAQVAGIAALAGVSSHTDLNGAGAISFYGDLAGGGHGVLLHRDGRPGACHRVSHRQVDASADSEVRRVPKAVATTPA